ncbi:hypothetical protein [Roseivivax lentus]|nr:hypothetical protein [Roseivivax lentus]
MTKTARAAGIPPTRKRLRKVNGGMSRAMYYHFVEQRRVIDVVSSH